MTGARRLKMAACGVSLAIGLVCAGEAFAEHERIMDQLTQAIEKAQMLRQRFVEYDAVFLRDPMRPLVDEQGERLAGGWLSGSLSVQGIIWSDEQPLAVVDGELLAPGAMVGPYTIQQIHPDGIQARRGEKTLFIPLDRGLEPPKGETLTPPLVDASQTPSAPAPASQ